MILSADSQLQEQFHGNIWPVLYQIFVKNIHSFFYSKCWKCYLSFIGLICLSGLVNMHEDAHGGKPLVTNRLWGILLGRVGYEQLYGIMDGLEWAGYELVIPPSFLMIISTLSGRTRIGGCSNMMTPPFLNNYVNIPKGRFLKLVTIFWIK